MTVNLAGGYTHNAYLVQPSCSVHAVNNTSFLLGFLLLFLIKQNQIKYVFLSKNTEAKDNILFYSIEPIQLLSNEQNASTGCLLKLQWITLNFFKED